MILLGVAVRLTDTVADDVMEGALELDGVSDDDCEADGVTDDVSVPEGVPDGDQGYGPSTRPGGTWLVVQYPVGGLHNTGVPKSGAK